MGDPDVYLLQCLRGSSPPLHQSSRLFSSSFNASRWRSIEASPRSEGRQAFSAPFFLKTSSFLLLRGAIAPPLAPSSSKPISVIKSTAHFPKGDNGIADKEKSPNGSALYPRISLCKLMVLKTSLKISTAAGSPSKVKNAPSSDL